MIKAITEYIITDHGLYVECRWKSDKESLYCYLFDTFYGWAKRKAGQASSHYLSGTEYPIFDEKGWIEGLQHPLRMINIYLSEKITHFNMSTFLVHKIKIL